MTPVAPSHQDGSCGRRSNRRPRLQCLLAWTRRRVVVAFVASFFILECILFLFMHERWLPALPNRELGGVEQHVLQPRKTHTIQRGNINKKNDSLVKEKSLIEKLNQKVKAHAEHNTPNMLPTIDNHAAQVMGNVSSRTAMELSNGNSLSQGIRRVTTQIPIKKNVAKQQQQQTMTKRKPHGWDPGAQGRHQEPTPLKVNTPIFVAALPKSGTTSIWQYINCGARAASHQWVKTEDGQSVQSGVCMRNNIWIDRPPFEGCGKYDVFADTGYSLFVSPGISDCYYPSISALPAIYKHYPNATIIMIARNSTSWLNSMQAWGDGSLLMRWKNCKMTSHLPSTPNDPDAFRAFYEWHTEHVRNFAQQHPSLSYIEVELESPITGQILQEQIGIPASCWGKCTPASKFCDRVSTVSFDH